MRMRRQRLLAKVLAELRFCLGLVAAQLCLSVFCTLERGCLQDERAVTAGTRAGLQGRGLGFPVAGPS